MLKKVHINLPLIEALQDIPGYMKYLKRLVAHKKKFEENETVPLHEECSAVLLKNMPIKRSDPGSFTIPVQIGGFKFPKVLCDSGASINLMPLSIYEMLKIGGMRPTSITLEMADRSTSRPKGVVEDVLIQVGTLIFPADFVVLDMEANSKVPIILGRSFLHTAGALIDVQKGELTLRAHEEEIKFPIDARERGDKCYLMEDCETEEGDSEIDEFEEDTFDEGVKERRKARRAALLLMKKKKIKLPDFDDSRLLHRGGVLDDDF